MLVRRFHQWPTVKADTVGKHSCGVALFAQLIVPGCRKEVLLAALFHDLGEIVTGDIPSPTKKMLSASSRNEIEEIELCALRENGFSTELLSDEEVALLKLCDCLDGLAYCVEERSLGNQSIRSVAEKYMEYTRHHLRNSTSGYGWYVVGQEVFHILEAAWRKYDVR